MNLQNLNVAELSAQEIENTDGDNWLRAVAKLLAAGVAFDEWYQQSGYIDRDMGMPFCA